MHSNAVEMNEITLGCLIDSCVKCDSLDKALEIVERERRRGVVINTIIYTTLIKGYTKQRNITMAWRVFEKMK
jgi:pentatricopeptide repeat domain-containing protein 1